MKRKNLSEKRSGSSYLENVRFFQYLPDRVRDSLNAEQRSEIARTIMELHKSNPRILQEIYMENPLAGEVQRPSMWRRLGRRARLALGGLWFAWIVQKSERRTGASLIDYLFLIIGLFLLLAFVVLVLFLLYGMKNMIGLDLFPGVHFFHVE